MLPNYLKYESFYIVEWMFESLPADIQNKLRPAELEINFLAESFLQDRVIARCQLQDSSRTTFHHGLFREKDGLELVRGRTVWAEVD